MVAKKPGRKSFHRKLFLATGNRPRKRKSPSKQNLRDLKAMLQQRHREHSRFSQGWIHNVHQLMSRNYNITIFVKKQVPPKFPNLDMATENFLLQARSWNLTMNADKQIFMYRYECVYPYSFEARLRLKCLESSCDSDCVTLRCSGTVPPVSISLACSLNLLE